MTTRITGKNISQFQAGVLNSAVQLNLINAKEKVTVSGVGSGGTAIINLITQSILYNNSNASSNFVVNIRGDGSTTLNSLLSNGESITCCLLNTNGATAYYATQIQVDGTTSGVTTKWQTAVPSSGNASAIDVYSFTVIKTASSTFTVLASQTRFV